MKPLATIPTYMTTGGDIELLDNCLRTLRETTDDMLDVMVVDDGSPDEDLREAVYGVAERYGATAIFRDENGGFSATVNEGLRVARDEGRDALLINADVEFTKKNWLAPMLEQRGLTSPGLASVVGSLLLYPNGTIQHAGIYFSLLTRQFDHLWKHAPGNLPIAREPRLCPVTGALQLIRHEALTSVGIYDETFRMGYEDVDYCIRTFLAGRECVYQPRARATHHESVFRGRKSEKLEEWQARSFLRIMEKYHDQNFAGLVPFL